MYNVSLPWWAYALMGAGLMLFLGLLTVSVKRNHGVKRSLFASPYILWMILFTLLPCVLIAYYALTDGSGQLTLDNFRAFWDSNHIMRENMRAVAGDEVAATIPRGSVNVDTLVYSLWMAFLCTAFSLLLGYPAALFMADRHMKLGSTLVVLFIIPMWMNFLLRTIAWMSLLEDNGLINAFLEWIGVGRVQLMYNQGAVLLGMVYNFLPFMVFPIYTSLSKMDPKLGEAAMDLGCNEAKTLLKVTMPLSIPGVISGHHDGVHAVCDHVLHSPSAGRRLHADVRRPDRDHVPDRRRLESGQCPFPDHDGADPDFSVHPAQG